MSATMVSPVAELEAGLQAMQALKPPGVSGSRINALTMLCVSNVQSESVLIQKLYTHFKRAPGTHKLGVLYVVDSVTRKWLDLAKQNGETVSAAAPDGSYAAGVNRVTELIPVLMNDILVSAPADQKEKIKKLVDIWEKGQTFPSRLVESFKERLNAPQQNASTTPPGSPPSNTPGNGNGTAIIPPNIMETLANLAKKTAGAAAPTATATPPSLSGPFGAGHAAMLGQSSTPAYSAAPAGPTPVSAQQPQPFQMPPVANQQPPAAFQVPPFGVAQQPPTVFPGAIPPQQPQPPQPGPPNVQQNLMLIQALLAQGLTLDQITAILAQMSSSGASAAIPSALLGGTLAPAAMAAVAAAANGSSGAAPYGAPHVAPQSWGGGGGNQGFGGRSRSRSRSRSPARYWESGGGRRSPPGGGRGGRGRDREYRQRSPPRTTPGEPTPPSAAEKWVEHDPTLRPGTIRVLSRTLFVGGVTVSEAELREIFGQFGSVQTCIVNREKRHAFVKMYTRRDAEAAKIGMEQQSTGRDDMGLRTRWGVGFGPRDCSDYSQGISVIPIAKLTEADRKWLLTAAWGGSGGRPIATGLVIEEPDIEIGAGVSSKAISRRMQTDRGGLNGPRSTRREEELAHTTVTGSVSGGGGGGSSGGRSRRGGREGRDRYTNSDELNYGDAVGDHGQSGGGGDHGTGSATFPFGLAVGANGMPIFPAGFAFPTADKS